MSLNNVGKNSIKRINVTALIFIVWGGTISASYLVRFEAVQFGYIALPLLCGATIFVLGLFELISDYKDVERSQLDLTVLSVGLRITLSIITFSLMIPNFGVFLSSIMSLFIVKGSVFSLKFTTIVTLAGLLSLGSWFIFSHMLKNTIRILPEVISL